MCTMEDKGTYAVVETALLEQDETEVGRSDLMMPICKEIELDGEHSVVKRTFFLADTEAFADPCCVVPDIGGPSNRYFVVKPRNEWSNLFIRWVQDEHKLDQMDPLQAIPMPTARPKTKRKRSKNKSEK